MVTALVLAVVQYVTPANNAIAAPRAEVHIAPRVNEVPLEPPDSGVPSAPAPSITELPAIPSPATVLTMGGSRATQRVVCSTSKTCNRVSYPWFFTSSGVSALQDALDTTSAEKIVVFGYSNGARVAVQWLRQHLDDPNIPSPDVLSIVVVGNPDRMFWPASPYQVIDVSRQYDGFADFPNNEESRYYFLAVLNALAGASSIHLNYRDLDINDPANAVWREETRNVTYVLTPTRNLPILGFLAAFFPALNERMKAQIETAYIRPVPFPRPAEPVVDPPADESEAEGSRMSEPAASQHATASPTAAAEPATAARRDVAADAVIAASTQVVPAPSPQQAPTSATPAADDGAAVDKPRDDLADTLTEDAMSEEVASAAGSDTRDSADLDSAEGAESPLVSGDYSETSIASKREAFRSPGNRTSAETRSLRGGDRETRTGNNRNRTQSAQPR